MNRGGALDRTVEIVANFLKRNPVSLDEIGSLITRTHGAIVGLVDQSPPPPPPPSGLTKKQIEETFRGGGKYIRCLECGVDYRTLTRHIRETHHLTPAEYIVKWGLPADYPMIAPDFADYQRDTARKRFEGRVK